MDSNWGGMNEHVVSVTGDLTPDVTKAVGHFAADVRRADQETWQLRFETAAHSYAFFSLPETKGVQLQRRSTDARGWEDWTDVGRDRYEATGALLPTPSPAPEIQDIRIWRFEDIWVWDAHGPELGERALAQLGVRRVQRAGGWIWKAVKLGWKYAPAVGRAMRDPRVMAAMWLAERGWRQLAEQARHDRAHMSRIEAEQRILVALARERQDRLNASDEEQRRKWSRYYSDLDTLIAINS